MIKLREIFKKIIEKFNIKCIGDEIVESDNSNAIITFDISGYTEVYNEIKEIIKNE